MAQPWSKTTEKVRAGDLLINPKVQRDVNPAHVRTLSREWNEMLVGTLTGWRVDGTVYLLDGQQRLRSKTGDAKLTSAAFVADPDYVFNVEVYDGITEAEAASIFLGLNRGRKNVDAYARWWVELTKGEDIATAMERAASRVGLKISTGSSRHEIGCVSTLRRVVARRGDVKANEEALVWALQVYEAAWGHSPAWRSEMVEALAYFKMKYDGKIDTVSAIKKFSAVPVESMLGQARMRSIGSNRVSNVLVGILRETYDYKRHGARRLEAA